MQKTPQFEAAEITLHFMSIIVKKQESKLCAKKHCDLIITHYESLEIKDNDMITHYNNVKKYIDEI